MNSSTLAQLLNFTQPPPTQNLSLIGENQMFSQNSSIFFEESSEASVADHCQRPTAEEMALFDEISFGVETVAQSVIGICGLIVNLLVLPTLCR